MGRIKGSKNKPKVVDTIVTEDMVGKERGGWINIYQKDDQYWIGGDIFPSIEMAKKIGTQAIKQIFVEF